MVLAATPEDERDFFQARVTRKVLPAGGDPPSAACWNNMTNRESVLRDVWASNPVAGFVRIGQPLQ
jgi:hypothetical protein